MNLDWEFPARVKTISNCNSSDFQKKCHDFGLQTEIHSIHKMMSQFQSPLESVQQLRSYFVFYSEKLSLEIQIH